MSMQTATALAAVLGVLSSAGAAQGASPRPLTEAIEVRPGATCVEGAALAGQVGAWLGADTVEADVWVKVEGSPEDARVVWFDMGRGDRLLARRRFSPGPERCDQLEAALGLAIALAIRVSLLDDLLGPREPGKPEPPRPVPPGRRALWGFGAGAMAGLGVLPGASLGASLRLEKEVPPSFAVRLGLFGLASRNEAFATTTGSFDAEGAAARLDACVIVELAAGVGARGCAGLLAGGLFAQGRDFANARSAASAWAAVANAVEGTVSLPDGWSLDVDVSLLVPLQSPHVGVLSAAGDVVEARTLTSTGVTMGITPVYHF
jgi:hypothetical protein